MLESRIADDGAVRAEGVEFFKPGKVSEAEIGHLGVGQVEVTEFRGPCHDFESVIVDVGADNPYAAENAKLRQCQVRNQLGSRFAAVNADADYLEIPLGDFLDRPYSFQRFSFPDEIDCAAGLHD